MRIIFLIVFALFLMSCETADVNETILTDGKDNYYFLKSAGGKLYYVTKLDSTKMHTLDKY